jgi:hypothetical protein
VKKNTNVCYAKICVQVYKKISQGASNFYNIIHFIRKCNLGHGCMWTHCVKTQFKMSKNSEIKFACTSGHSMYTHKFFGGKRTSFVSREKIKKWCSNMTIYWTFFLYFLHNHIKCSFTPKYLHGKIECPHVNVEFYFGISWHSWEKYLRIFHKRFICTCELKHHIDFIIIFVYFKYQYVLL